MNGITPRIISPNWTTSIVRLISGFLTLVAIAFSAKSDVVEGYLYRLKNYTYWGDENIYRLEPPADVEIVELIMLTHRMPKEYEYWDPFRFGDHIDTIRGARTGNDIYIELVKLARYDKNKTSLPIWIKGTFADGKLIIPEGETILINSTWRSYSDEGGGYYKEPELVTDTVISRNVADIVSDCIHYEWGEYHSNEDFGSWWETILSMDFFTSPLIMDMNTDTWLIKSPDTGLALLTTSQQPILHEESSRNNWITSQYLIGQIKKQPPVSLPDFQVYYYFGDPHESEYLEPCCFEVRMNLVTEDDYLLDFNRMGVIFRTVDRDGSIYHEVEKRFYDYSETERDSYTFFINPYEPSDNLKKFRNYKISAANLVDMAIEFHTDKDGYPRIIFSELYEQFNWLVKLGNLEVKCFYEKEDGSRIETPWKRAIKESANVSEVADGSSLQVGDNRVFDLTGRLVNPDNLAPGIYIRNGRKFLVGRN